MQKKMVAIFILALILKQLLWSAFIPLWHFPDEQAHFAQVQNYAEGNVVDRGGLNTTSQEIYQSEVFLGTDRDWAGNNKFTYHPEYNVTYSNTAIGIYENEIKNFPQSFRKEMIIAEATRYPPLYYRIVSFAYSLFYSYDLIARVFVVRIISIIFFLGLVIVSYHISRQLFPQNTVSHITLPVLIGFHPMFSYVSAGVNSDNLFNLLFAISLLTSLRLLKNGWKLLDIFVMLLTLILASYTKPQGKLMILIYLFPMIVTMLTHKKRKYFLFVLISGMVVIGIALRDFFINQQFISDIPGLIFIQNLSIQSFLQHSMWTLKHTYREVLPWYWGVFRWLSLTYPRSIYRAINIISAFSLVGLGIAVFRTLTHKKIVVEKLQLWFLFYASISYFFAITVFDYLFTLSHHFSLGIQGRYFFPTLVSQTALLIIGFYTIIPENSFKKVLIQLLGLGMILLHVYSFFFVISSYYSFQSIRIFFLQASQYKPEFFKTPYLEFYLACSFLSLFFLIWYYLRIQTHEKT